ncbi:MAG: hypothetical protein WAK93_21720 [Solirubrobacteraceae bacterium]
MAPSFSTHTTLSAKAFAPAFGQACIAVRIPMYRPTLADASTGGTIGALVTRSVR